MLLALSAFLAVLKASPATPTASAPPARSFALPLTGLRALACAFRRFRCFAFAPLYGRHHFFSFDRRLLCLRRNFRHFNHCWAARYHLLQHVCTLGVGSLTENMGWLTTRRWQNWDVAPAVMAKGPDRWAVTVATPPPELTGVGVATTTCTLGW